MKPDVAFVEWDTKVPIWRYEGAPSYRYDTSLVIDATAFGANATAMEGCLVGISPFRTAGRLSELVDFLNTKDVVFVATRYNWRPTLELVHQLTPFTMLGFGMGLDQLREGMQREGEFEALMDLCGAVGLVTTFAEDLGPYLRLMTGRPVEYLPLCYPYRYVRETYRTPGGRAVIVPGNVWNNDIGGRRDDLLSLLLAHELLRGRPECALKLSDRKVHKAGFPHDVQMPIRVRNRMVGCVWPNLVDVRGAMPWHEFLWWAGGSALSIHCDWTWTTGRMAADMAALGIPHIGGNSDHTKHLFPDLCFEEFDVESMLTRASMILDNPQLGQRLVEIADLWGEQLDYPNWRAWFARLVEEHRPC